MGASDGKGGGEMKILGIDPGFSSLGWAVIDFDDFEVRSDGCGVIRTKVNKLAKKHDDNVERCAVIHHELARLHSEHSFALIAAEAQSWTRFANADRAVAMAWGVIASTSERHGAPVIQIRPQMAKKALTGKQSASKSDVQSVIESKVVGSAEHLGQLAKTHQNHAADAFAVALASLAHPLVRTVRRMG